VLTVWINPPQGTRTLDTLALLPPLNGKMAYMEVRCENCGELIEPISDPNPSVSSDDPPSFDLLCAKCRLILETHTEE